MGRLRNLVVNTSFNQGLPFYILNAILSTPQLESVQFGPSMCYPVKLDPSFPKDLQFTSPVCSLTSFRRTLQSFERYSRAQAEADLLHCLFNQFHHTLQIAEMPSDTAPLRVLINNDWPCLRELILRGGSQQSSKPMVQILGRMPNLRVLKLELAQRSGEGPRRVCPPGWAGGFPWPNLEVLTVSYPHPDDGLYAHLPSSLQELTLRCFPRHYVATATGKEGDFMRRHMYDSGWCSSLPSSSAEILGVLCRCSSSLVCLRHLDIEFEESDEDIQLLRYIATAFSTLTFLQFLRYRKSSEHPQHTTSCADLGHALAPLTHLRLLRVHLDLEDTDDAGTVGEALSALA
ncbi:uncharacterized protein TRAVEDRAFT_34554 [Trametes versicolor FP-101664 SS1]|uniref:uncharacterized protein n=1 Tax=Trametes versicolor (strain FP-101664) TaxID=717944 RepID=UPI0004623AB7|nr:uncharacterized protein TRAVEDRAFT_34554 [Trametes versicolor FP-101664 SS1]EIW63417.1 hypothetical protein TRAVEDRAFT_34554 [Trametes versicolor FP-101664 SS1]